MTESWKRVEIAVESEPIPPSGMAAILRLRIPLPDRMIDAGDIFIRGPFGFERAVSDATETSVVAVSVGGKWVTATDGVAHALDLGEVLVVWVVNKSNTARTFRGKIVGLVPAETPERAQA